MFYKLYQNNKKVPSTLLLFIFHAARKQNKNTRAGKLRTASLLPRQKVASTSQLFWKQEKCNWCFRALPPCCGWKTVVFSMVLPVRNTIAYHLISPALPGEVSFQTQGSPVTLILQVYKPSLMNRNTGVTSTEALSVCSSGVSMKCSFLWIILTDIMVKPVLSGVLNVATVKGVPRRIPWIFRNLKWLSWLWGMPLKWITLLKWVCTWF